MKKLIGIYKITSPSGKIYIGQSKDINKRFNQYFKIIDSIKKQPILYNSLKKHGPDSHIFEVLEECEFEQLNIRERYYQDLYIGDGYSLAGTLMNCTLTETSELPRVYSDETLKKMSEKQSGENHPMFGKTHSDEYKRNMSKKISSIHYCKGKKGKDNPHYGKGDIYQMFDDDMNLLEEGPISHFKDKGFIGPGVYSAANGKLEKYKGFNWRKKGSEYTPRFPKKKGLSGYGRVISQYDLDGNLIKSTTIDNYKKEGFRKAHIYECCKGELKQYKGYRFEYL